MELKRINVVKPFTYWIGGYERRDFTIGEHDVPYDCAAYAEKAGYTKQPQIVTAPEVKTNARAGTGTGTADTSGNARNAGVTVGRAGNAKRGKSTASR